MPASTSASARGGKEVWLQASYNPIVGPDGKPFKVVKYATDVTAQVKATEVLQAAVRQTQEVVGAAKENDLRHRIPLDGKTGDIAQLCEGVNGLIDTMSSMIGEISETLSHADHCRAGNCQRQHGSFAADRRTGVQPGGNRGQHGGTHQHGAAERRKRAAGQQACFIRLRGRDQGWFGRGRSGSHHGRHHPGQPQDRRHHRCDRRNRIPDQHPGAERRGRGRTCR